MGICAVFIFSVLFLRCFNVFNFVVTLPKAAQTIN